MTAVDQWDVIVIGGGAAGLSGALTLARARRSVVVIDSGAPRNAPASGVHGFLTRDGIAPAELVRLGRAEVESYGGTIVEGAATAISGTAGAFRVTLADGQTHSARAVLVATGLRDELPPIEGLAERWGRDVVHCPYCHGWEVRDRQIAVIAAGPMAVHQAVLFGQWTDDVTLLTHDAPPLGPEALRRLAARGVPVIDGAVERLIITDDRLRGAQLADGRQVEAEVVVVGAPMRAHDETLAGLGLTADPHPMGVGTAVASDGWGRTSIPGVWVAGNVTDLQAQVVTSAAAGVMAGAAINADLVEAEVDAAVAALA